MSDLDSKLKLLLNDPKIAANLISLLQQTSAFKKHVKDTKGLSTTTLGKKEKKVYPRPSKPCPGTIHIPYDISKPDFIHRSRTSCSLCGARHETSFMMVWMPDSKAYVVGWVLEGDDYIDPETKYQESRHITGTCHCCWDYLHTLSTDELCRMVLSGRINNLPAIQRRVDDTLTHCSPPDDFMAYITNDRKRNQERAEKELEDELEEEIRNDLESEGDLTNSIEEVRYGHLGSNGDETNVEDDEDE
jgi:hypothetical protein